MVLEVTSFELAGGGALGGVSCGGFHWDLSDKRERGGEGVEGGEWNQMGRERGLVRFMSTRIICPSLLESRPNTMTTLTTANNEGCRVISLPPPPPLPLSLSQFISQKLYWYGKEKCIGRAV